MNNGPDGGGGLPLLSPWRLTGVVLLAVCVLVYDPLSGALLHRLFMPLLLAVSAWLLVRNLAAVLIGAAVLAVTHSDTSGDWVTHLAYPGIALAAGLALIVISMQRFRARIAATHAERWRERHRPAPEAAARHLVRASGRTATLSRLAGLQRLGVNRTVLPPDSELLVGPGEHGNEAFLYILTGRGELDADGEKIAVAPGDCFAFARPSAPRRLSNPSTDDLVCLIASDGPLGAAPEGAS